VSDERITPDESALEIDRLTAEIAKLERVRSNLEAEVAMLRVELRASQASRMLLASDISRLATEKICALQEKDEQIRAVERKIDQWSAKDRRLQLLEATLQSIQHSASWRVTKPLRDLMAIIRRFRGTNSPGPNL
jgi:predicted  nucleic acid-binding Zn-ribbon protein